MLRRNERNSIQRVSQCESSALSNSGSMVALAPWARWRSTAKRQRIRRRDGLGERTKRERWSRMGGGGSASLLCRDGVEELAGAGRPGGIAVELEVALEVSQRAGGAAGAGERPHRIATSVRDRQGQSRSGSDLPPQTRGVAARKPRCSPAPVCIGLHAEPRTGHGPFGP